MHVTLTTPHELTVAQIKVWRRLQTSRTMFDSPFFCPEFTQAVASVRGGIEVAVLQDQGTPRGFFPFQRICRYRGQPAGMGFNEFHGVIASKRLRWTAPNLIEQCGLAVWNYDHARVAQGELAEFHTVVGDSPYIDLSDGFAAYCDRKRSAGSSIIPQTIRKARKLGREVGPWRLELHRADQLGLDRLIEWKSAQHRRTGVPDVFQFPWVLRLLETIRDTRTPFFQGLLSVLHAGGQPVAVHLGMRSGGVAHMWYPAFDPSFGKYSPGIILFVELAKALAEEGVQRIDFGPGPQRYKRSLMSGAIPVAIGAVDRYRLARWARHSWAHAGNWVRGTALRTPVRVPAELLYRFRHWVAMR